MEKPERAPRDPARGTKIEWATHTANWLAGCTRVSPACMNCYAETMTARLAMMPNAPARYREGVVRGRRWTGHIAYDADALNAAFGDLARAKRSRRLFVNSMSDTFHAEAPPESLRDLAIWIRYVTATGMAWPHVVMLLTKRPDRLLAWQREYFPDGLPSWVWVGTTVEDQRRADERIPTLLEVRAEVRFLSCEPLLGPIRLDYAEHPDGSWWGYLAGMDGDQTGYGMGGRTGGLSWVIVGGESGPGARPMHPEWARSLRDQCVAAGVPFFFKQWGAWYPEGRNVRHDGSALTRNVATLHGGNWYLSDGTVMSRYGKPAAGRLLDGRTWDEFPGGVRDA